MMWPVPSENSEAVLETMAEDSSEAELNMIWYVATDSPSAKFFRTEDSV